MARRFLAFFAGSVAAGAPIAGQRLSDVQSLRGGRVGSTADGKPADEVSTVCAPGERYVAAADEQAPRAMNRPLSRLVSSQQMSP